MRALPSGPVLVRATVMALGLAMADPVGAAPPESGGSQASRQFQVSIPGTDAAAQQRVQHLAVARILRSIRMPDSAPTEPRAWQVAEAERLLQEVPKVFDLPEPTVEAGESRLDVQLSRADWKALQKRFQPRWWGSVVGLSPSGSTIVVFSVSRSVVLKPGDVLYDEERPIPADQLDQVLERSTERPIRVLRDGAPQASEVVRSMPDLPDPRDMAPTCGPCCHGDCGDMRDPFR